MHILGEGQIVGRAETEFYTLSANVRNRPAEVH